MTRVFVYEYLSGGGELASEDGLESLLPLGVAMRDAIVDDLLALPGVAVTCAVCDRAGAVAPAGRSTAAAPRRGEPALAFVQRLAAAHDRAWIVAPESDGLLAQLHEAVGPGRWIGCERGAIRITSSKSATLAALARRRVTTPLAFAQRFAGRWVVKPDDGAGAIATVVHGDLGAAMADLQRRRDARQPATLEPFVDGEALSISLLVGADDVEVLAFNRQDIAIADDGRLAFRGVRHHCLDPLRDPRAARLHALASDVVGALPGLRGFVGIDLVWHPRRGPVVIEVNPRVTCAYVGLSATLKRNLAAAVLALHAAPEASHAGA